MRRLYTLILYLLVPWLMARLYWKSRRFVAYRQRVLERFSIGLEMNAPVDIWLHAVSVGEVVAATPLIERMLGQQYRVLVTTMTPTGSQEVMTRFKDRVEHCYLPYDLPWCVGRFFKRVQPRIGVIMETELWPNVIHFSVKKQIPLVLVNARLSDHSFSQYKALKYLLSPLLAKLTWIGAQSPLDAHRYQQLGAPASHLAMVGNLKFDMMFEPSVSSWMLSLKEAWGATRPVFIAASTHEDEESQLLSQLPGLQREIPGLLLLLVPRRPERFQTVLTLCQQQGFRTGRRSLPETIEATVDIVVMDSMGELMEAYQVSDYAFVGGSLVPVAGHNVLEPIAVRIPVFCGPFMHNSKAICDELSDKQAIERCDSVVDLSAKLIQLHHSPQQRAEQISKAWAVLQDNRGTCDRYWSKIQDIMSSKEVERIKH